MSTTIEAGMTARWHVADDPYGEPTLFHGDTAVFRESDFAVAGAEYRDLLWSVLTAVLAPDEATVERLAEESHDAVVGGLSPWSGMREDSRDIGREHIRAVLAALADTEKAVS